VYLKRLELSGFKSFAERTRIELGPGITAIVGPNGSGKSNLADAVAWALGEQSLRSLRTSRSQEVIFNGSAERRPVGMAEVTALFDNSDGALALPFPEVAVTRRVFRSSESEYLINDSLCRLRDIQDLFSGTGLGRAAYAFVTQAEVDAVLSIRPEERRSLFEEAAGIQKFRHRQKETERKLEQTRANLLRLGDLMGELEGQRDRLQEQALKAERYKRLCAEQANMKRSMLLASYHSALASLRRARERTRQAEAEEAELRASLAQIAEQREAASGELQRLEHQLLEHHESAARLSTERQEVKGELALIEERARMMGERRGLLLRQIEEAQDGREAMLAAAQEDSQRIQAARERESHLMDGAAVVEQALDKARTLSARMQEAADEAGSRVMTAAEKEASARSRLAQSEAHLRAVEAASRRVSQERARLLARRQEAEESARQTRARLERIEQEIDELLTALGRAGDTSREAGEASVRARERLAEKRRLLSGLEGRLETLEELHRTRDDLPRASVEILRAATEGRLNLEGDRFRLAAELLQVPENLETAVGAALGEAAFWLVCHTEEEAEAAIAFAKHASLGGVTVVPLELLSPAPASAFEAAKGRAVARAADLVKFSPEDRLLVEHLLGDVLVADERGEALQAAAALKARGCVVTRDGEIFWWNGVRSWGKTGAAGFFARRRELDELSAQMKREKAEEGSLEQELSDAERIKAEADKEAADIERQVEGIRAERLSLEASKESFERELRSADERAEAQRAEAAQLDEELAAARDEARSIDAEAQACAQERSRAEDCMAALEAGGDMVTAGIQDLQLAASELRLEQAEAASQAALAEQAARQAEAEGRRLASAAQAAADELAQFETRERELSAALQQHKIRLDEAEERVRAVQEAIEETKQSREEAGAALEGLSRRAQESQALVEEAAAKKQRFDVRAAQIEGETRFVEQSLLEQYGLSSDRAQEARPPQFSQGTAEQRLREIEDEIAAIGPVNLAAEQEAEELEKRLGLMQRQRDDLEQAAQDLERIIAETEEAARQRFVETFEAVGREYDVLFKRLFQGGSTQLILTEPSRPLESGIEVDVALPGKRKQNLALLSGGERALTALALLLALLKVRPAPFVVLDEIDAPLDDANVRRYTEIVKEFAQRSQFIVITHNRGTMEAADTLHGVTMEDPGVSKLVSVRLSEVAASSA
jgi:chromosome segregation protein